MAGFRDVFGDAARRQHMWHRSRLLLGVLAVVLVLLILRACQSYTADLNYRVDAVVAFNGQEFHGSTVWKAHYKISKFVDSGDHISAVTWGEAIPFDIPGYGLVFFEKGGFHSDLFQLCPKSHLGDLDAYYQALVSF